MTTPRLISLTALAASLLIVIATITQANGLTSPAHHPVSGFVCPDTLGHADCILPSVEISASAMR